MKVEVVTTIDLFGPFMAEWTPYTHLTMPTSTFLCGACLLHSMK